MEIKDLRYTDLISVVNIENPTIANGLQIFQYAKKGVSVSLFFSFAAAVNMPYKLLASILNSNLKTVTAYQYTQKNLEPATGEHLLKLIALYNKGIELFRNIDEFNSWLNKPFWNMDEKPIEWLITPGGVDLVAQELDQLGYGYPV